MTEVQKDIKFWEARSAKAKRLYNDAKQCNDNEDMVYYRKQFNDCEAMLDELYAQL